MKRLLIVGCGDVGMRMLPLLRGRYRLFALSRSGAARCRCCAHWGSRRWPATWTMRKACAVCSGLPHDMLHFAPPPGTGARDGRTGNLIRALQKARSIPQRLVYISTSGVYGDCGGAPGPRARSAAAADRACRAACGCRAAAARVGTPERCQRDDPAGARDLRGRSLAAGAPAGRDAGAGRAGRPLHQSHPRRRPGAHRAGRAHARPRPTRLQRFRRFSLADGGILRPGGRQLRSAPRRRASRDKRRRSAFPRRCCRSCGSRGAWPTRACGGSCA